MIMVGASLVQSSISPETAVHKVWRIDTDLSRYHYYLCCLAEHI